MNAYLKVFVLIIIIITGSACRKNLDFAPSIGSLEFSKDTVFLDTVFSNIRTATFSFKVYNRSKNNIEIPTIALAKGENSSFRLNVDGEAGKEFTNIPLFAEDSLFVFVESTFDSSITNSQEFLNTDVIQFDSNGQLQEVHLVNLVKDAVFLFPKSLDDGSMQRLNVGVDDNGNPITVEGFFMNDDELQFNNEKPYVIYGYAAVAQGKVLEINEGARVHFHQDSGIYVDAGAAIHINGSLSTDEILLENEVIFSGDRLGNEFKDIPGQWGSLWISSGSSNNTIDYLTIQNATVGIFLEGNNILEANTLAITNSQIHNSSVTNLWSKNGYVIGSNLVLGKAGMNSLHLNLGGKYEFTHCTIANFWNNGFRLGRAVTLDNFDSTSNADLQFANFSNCIIDGNTPFELALSTNDNNLFNYNFLNCLLKFDTTSSQFENDPLFDFENLENFDALIFNENADYFDNQENDFRILETSAARDKANFEGAFQIPLDLLGIDRTGSPDIGAYEVQATN